MKVWDTLAMLVTMACFAGVMCAISRGEDDRARQGRGIAIVIASFSSHLSRTVQPNRFVPDPTCMIPRGAKGSGLGPRASGLGPRALGLGPQASGLGPWCSS